MINEYDENKRMIAIMRQIAETKTKGKTNLLNEEQISSTKKDAIAITNDDNFGVNVLTKQKEAFKNAVDGGTEFSDEKNVSSDAESNPIVYYPNSGNLVFSGVIPSMNNLKWQYSLNDSDGDGVFFWSDGLRLTDENIKKLNKLRGHYLNWRDSWQKEGELLKGLEK